MKLTPPRIAIPLVRSTVARLTAPGTATVVKPLARPAVAILRSVLPPARAYAQPVKASTFQAAAFTAPRTVSTALKGRQPAYTAPVSAAFKTAPARGLVQASRTTTIANMLRPAPIVAAPRPISAALATRVSNRVAESVAEGRQPTAAAFLPSSPEISQAPRGESYPGGGGDTWSGGKPFRVEPAEMPDDAIEAEQPVAKKPRINPLWFVAGAVGLYFLLK